MLSAKITPKGTYSRNTTRCAERRICYRCTLVLFVLFDRFNIMRDVVINDTDSDEESTTVVMQDHLICGPSDSTV